MRDRARRRAERRGLTLLGLVFLLGCPRPTPSDVRFVSSDYFPLIEGTSWLYEVRAGDRRLEIEATARGPMRLPKRTDTAFVVDETSRGARLGFVETSPVAYVAAGDYLGRIVAVDYGSSGELRALSEDLPTLFLPLHPRPGHRWSQQTTVFRTPEGGGAQLGWSFEVKPLASVTVPAGRYDDVIEIDSSYRDLTGSDLAPEMVYRDFYARGVGLVRSTSEDPSGNAANRVEQVLIEVHFPKSD